MKLARILLFLAIISSTNVAGAILAYMLNLTDGNTTLFIVVISVICTGLFMVLGVYFQNKANRRIYHESQRLHDENLGI